MSNEYDYVKADIAMEVDYPASQGVQAPETPKAAFVSYVIDTPGAKPGEEGLYDGCEVTSVPANSREVVQWQGAYRRFEERVNMAHLKLQGVEAAWLQAMEDWKAELLKAAKEYAPVHEEIEARKAMMEAQDALEDERERQGKKVIEAAALEAEDAVLGPRRWVLFFKQDSLGRKTGSKTLHTVDCRHVQNKSKYTLSKPMRQDAAKTALSEDRRVMRCGTCLPDTLFQKRPTIPQQRQG
jgi:hypothetical protein